MRKRSKKIIVISIIICLIVLLLGGFAFAFFATDTFKSDKFLFSKYLVQNEEIMQLFKDEDIDSYTDRQNLTTYSSKGAIKANVTFPSDNSDQNMANALQNCSITFEENVDKQHNYFYNNIKANYSDTQSLDFEILRNNDIYAIKINDVVNKYFGVENNNLQEFAKNMGVDEETLASIPVKIDLSQMQPSNLFNDEEINQLKQKYWQIIANNLTDDMFSKEQAEDSTVYVLTIKEEQVKKIISDIYTTFNDDEVIWNKVKIYMKDNLKLSDEQVNQYTENIKNGFQQLQTSFTGNQDSSEIGNYTEQDIIFETPENVETINKNIEVKIKVYVSNKKITKTEIIVTNGTQSEDIKLTLIKNESGFRIEGTQAENQISLNFQKIKNGNNIKYEISAAQGINELFDLNISFDGLNTNNVIENAQLNFDYDINGLNTSKTKFAYTYNNTKSFGADFTKVETDGNILLFNTAPNAESIQNLLTKIAKRLDEVNTEKMKAAGIKNTRYNPFMYYIPTVIISSQNSILSQTSKNISNSINDDEREQISTKLLEITTNIISDETRKDKNITKKDLESGLKEANIDVKVVENKDKTFTITVKGTSNKYNVNQKGNLISYEYANK